VAVPDVGGYETALARTLLEAAGLTVGSVETAPAPTPPNVAVNTRPPAGATLPPGAQVTLVVSVGGATIRVPHLLGRTLDEARRIIDSVGLALGEYSLRTTLSAEPGTIIEQRPSAGTLAAPGARVLLRIARRENP
jgi:serine/threonine-protein kinase